MLIKAIVFDLYGTLLSIGDKANPYKALVQSDRYVHRAVLVNNFSSIMDACRFLNIDMSSGSILNVEEGIKQELDSVSVYPEVLPVLQWLRDEGYALGLISNLATPYKEPFFKMRLNDFIDCSVFSCDVGCMKPEMEIYRMMSQKLGVSPEEVLMVGDSLRFDVIGSRAFGFNSLLLDRNDIKDFSKKIKSLEDLRMILGS